LFRQAELTCLIGSKQNGQLKRSLVWTVGVDANIAIIIVIFIVMVLGVNGPLQPDMSIQIYIH